MKKLIAIISLLFVGCLAMAQTPVSDVATNGSLDGVNYFSAGDTITVTSLTADGFDSETLDYTGYLWPYLKLNYIQSGTAVTIPKVYIYSKQ